MLEPAAATGPGIRAFLRIGGTSLARQQLALVLALGCERVVCIAPALIPELVELQHIAERAGVQFHVIPAVRPLVGLVTAGDELIVLADGLFVSIHEAAGLLEAGQAVLVQPIEQGLAGGFERLDLNTASAGAMRLPGRLVERVAELPEDCDAVSTLQRIALQAGVRQRALPTGPIGGPFWCLVRSEEEAHALEPQWIRQRLLDGEPLGPSRWLARTIAYRLGSALLHAGSGPGLVMLGAVLLALIGFGAGWFGLAALGLTVCATGWITTEIATFLSRIESEVVRPRSVAAGRTIYGWVLDATIVVLAAWGSLPGGVANGSASGREHYFAAFILVALLRILPLGLGRTASAWLADRALLALALAAPVIAGIGSEAIHAGAVLAALVGMALPGVHGRLTRP